MSDAYSYNDSDVVGYLDDDMPDQVASAYSDSSYSQPYSEVDGYTAQEEGDNYANIEDVISGDPGNDDGTTGKDWNGEFQRILENEKGYEKYLKLSQLAADFVYAAQTYGQIIIAESSLPVEQKTIKPAGLGGIAGGEKYVCVNILFKFALDTTGLYGDDEAAMKSASNELKGLMSYYNCQVSGICFPLMALIDFRGFRLVALTLLPISKHSIIYGSADAGKTVHASNHDFNEKMKVAASMLNLKGHIVGKSDQIELYSAGDIEGHMGSDGRFYLLDFGRVFPPQVKMIKDFRRRHLYELLRPELVSTNPVPLSSDALTAWGSHDASNDAHNEEVKKATLRLYSSVIPEFANYLDQLPEDALPKLRLTEEFHRSGINLRHMGFVRNYSKSPAVQRRILLECVARSMKSRINELLRQKNRELKIPSEEPYRKVILAFLNNALARSKMWWEQMQRDTMLKFVDCLFPEERIDVQVFVSQVDLVPLLIRFQELTGVVLSQQTLEEIELDPKASLKLVDPDIEAIESRVRYMNLIEHSSGVVLAHEAMQCTGRASERLFAMADAKFRRSLERTPNSSLTLFDWAKMLHTQAQRIVDMLNPHQELTAAETGIAIVQQLTRYRSKTMMKSPPSSDTESRVLRAGSTVLKPIQRQDMVATSLKRSATKHLDDSQVLTANDPTLLQAKALGCFASAEDKLRRALKIKAEYAEAKLELATLLYNYGIYLLSLKPLGEQTKYDYSHQAEQKLIDSVAIDPTRVPTLTQRSKLCFKRYLQANDFSNRRDAFLESRPILAAIASALPEDAGAHYDLALLCSRFSVNILNRGVSGDYLNRYMSLASTYFKQAITADPAVLTRLERYLQLDATPDDLIVYNQIGASVGPVHQLVQMRCQVVSSVSLPRCNIDETIIQSLLGVCTNLKFIWLENSKKITDATVKFIAANCKSVESLSFKDCKSITHGPLLETTSSSDSIFAAARGASFAGVGGLGAMISSPLAARGGISEALGTGVAIGSSLASSGANANKRSALSAYNSVCTKLKFLYLSGCPLIESKQVFALSIFEKLDTLCIAGVNKLVDADLIQFLEQSTQLGSLDISECFQLTNASLNAVAKLEKLSSFSAAGCKNITDEGVIAALKNCSALTCLDLSQDRAITDAALKQIAGVKTLSLKTLLMSNCDNITDNGVKAILKRAASSLYQLDLSGCSQLSDSSISRVGKYCTNIAELKLAQCTKLTSKTVDSIVTGCTSLTSIDLSSCINISTGIKELVQRCPLQSLSLAGCLSVAEDISEVFSRDAKPRRCGSGLKVLDLSDFKIRDENLSRILSVSTALQCLRLCQCAQLSNSVMSKIALLENLSELHLDGLLGLTDVGIDNVLDQQGCVWNTLRVLSVQNCPKLTDLSMSYIADRARGLRRFLLSKWRLTTAPLQAFFDNCSDIEDVYISQCNELNIPEAKLIRNHFPRVKALFL